MNAIKIAFQTSYLKDQIIKSEREILFHASGNMAIFLNNVFLFLLNLATLSCTMFIEDNVLYLYRLSGKSIML